MEKFPEFQETLGTTSWAVDELQFVWKGPTSTYIPTYILVSFKFFVKTDFVCHIFRP